MCINYRLPDVMGSNYSDFVDKNSINRLAGYIKFHKNIMF